MTQREDLLRERLHEAALALRKTLNERDALVLEKSEPVAIVGLGCRFPGGADSVEAFWDLLEAGRDAVQPLEERWKLWGASPSEDAPRWAGLLTGPVDSFDAAFFGISPREARSLDPQHRLLLEVGWEALEDAGVPPHVLQGSRTGVFLGATNTDYAGLVAQQPRDEQDAYAVTGNLLSIAAGRLSYTWGLEGPCMTLDTVCSSALVAVHLACRSLRARECDLALAGGVNLLLSPDTMDALGRTQALSPEGRCKTFDALANGFARAEGCGLVVLKRLRDAQRDGDTIWALIRGSAVNQDGRSTGLTAPNVLAQESLLRDALRDARVEPKDISFVETHGTGTSLGDPIEVEALRAVLGPLRADGSTCTLGAVKTNLGHLEAAAGIAGLIKSVLALHHERIPQNLHFRALNPRLRLEGTALTLATAPVAWPRSSQPRFAGVSAFGMSGTNAHVVLEEAPAKAPVAAAAERSAELVVLSAKSPAALDAVAARLRDHLETHATLSLGEVAFSLATTRSPLPHRLAITATSREGLREALAAAAQGAAPAGATRGALSASRGKLAFLFTGQGAQVPGMGRGLHAAWPAFREVFDRCTALFDGELARPLRDVMWAEPGSAEAALLDQTAYTQPALFTLELALVALWRSWGVEPDLLAGHSIGELAAACASGVFSLEDAVKLVAARGRLMQALPPGGAMVTIAATEEEILAAVAPHAASVAIAAVNGPEQVVIAGAAEPVQTIAAAFAARGVRTKALRVSHAFHSPLLDPMLDDFRRVAATVTYRAPDRAVISNLTGTVAGPEIATPDYWVRHVREAVRFADGVRALHQAGATTFVEVGPTPALLGMVAACLPGAEPALLASLRSGRDEAASLLEALGGAWAQGHEVAWPGVFPGGRQRVSLPTYPWQRQRYWPARARVGAPVVAADRGVVADYYDAVARTDALARGQSDNRDLGEKYLTFAPFSEVVPGFSWMLTTATPDAHEEHVKLVLKAQQEMRAVLFRHVDFSSCSSVLDFGCGYATDLIGLGQKYPHLTLHGYTISAEQANLGGERARKAGLGGRVEIYNRDSARSAFPQAYNLIFGVEVACHIRDKRALFANVGEHLEDGGLLLLSDFVSNMAFDIDHEEASSFLATKDHWIEAFSRLRIVDCVDVSPQIANFLHDPSFDSNVERLERYSRDRNIGTAFKSYDQLSKLLRRGLASYVLLTVRKEGGQVDEEELRRHNRRALEEMVPYAVFDRRGAGRREEDDRFLELAWEPLRVPAARATASRWLLLGEGGGLGAALGSALEAAGQLVVHAAGSDTSVAAVRALLAGAFSGQAPTAVVHLGSLDGDGALDSDGVEAALVRGCDSVLATAQALSAASFRDAPRLWLVTRGAQAAGGGEVSVAQAPLLGLGRVIAMEHAELRCCRVDLDPARPEQEVAALLTELLADDAEDEIAWRAGERLAARLVHRQPEAERRERLEPAAGRPFRLELDRPGVLDHLALRAMERRAPGPGEVEIAVEAAGLNFLDVLLALGVMPDDLPESADAALALGGECAGRVVAVGDSVQGLAVGDPVIALGRGCFASHITTEATLVLPRPAGLSATEAAALPIACLTAWYALDRIAHLQPGERVLIHAATGGVGLCAVAWAQRVGAEVYATAGTPEKRAHLESLGVRYVSDSRSDRFVADVRAWTGGEGVDVVLNSLSGDLIGKSLDLLRDHGRFVELGKRDYHANNALGLRPFLRNLSFSLLDVRGMIQKRPTRVRALLEEVLGLIAAGAFTPLPLTIAPIGQVASVFRRMAQAQHLGKLVITLEDPEAQIRAPREASLVRADGTYLVTGGLGGLGLSVAGWLARQGAGHLVLVSRSGAASVEQQAAVAELEALGARVTVAKADVANRAELEPILREIAASERPLAGVLHAAGLADPGMLKTLTPARFRAVMAPKVLGALHLHDLTREARLDFFVMYASASGILGLGGTGNYAAANTFLDALAHHRRALGLPALSVDWGVFSEVGLAAGRGPQKAELVSRGMRGMTPEQGLSALARLLDSDRAQVGVIPLDVRQWVEFYPAAASSRRLSRLLLEERAGAGGRAGDRELLQQLTSAEPSARAGRMQDFLRAQVSHVLRIPEGELESEAPLTSLGMDSLMGLELRNRIEVALGLKVPATLLWTYPTLTALGVYLASELHPAAPVERSPLPPDSPVDLAAMSRDESERLIDEEFEALE